MKNFKECKEILFVSGTLEIGGTEKHLSLILPELVKKNFVVSIFIIGSPGALAPLIEQSGVKVHVPLGIRTIEKFPKKIKTFLLVMSSLLTLKFIIFTKKPHILHMFLPLSYLVGGLVAKFSKIPFTIMSRRSRNHYMTKHKISKYIELYLHKSTDLLLANSQEVIADLICEGAKTDQLKLIHNGIKLIGKTQYRNFRTQQRLKMGIVETKIVLIVIANIYEYKGYDDIIEAIENLPDRLRDQVVLLSLGEDRGYKEVLDKKLRLSEIESDIRFIGSVSDVIPYLAAADIGILASHEEGFSNAILDYMSASLPVIATNVGGNMEAVEHERSGFIIEPRDSQDLSKRLEYLCRCKEVRVAMGAQARIDVERHFSVDKCVAEYHKIYASLAHNDYKQRQFRTEN